MHPAVRERSQLRSRCACFLLSAVTLCSLANALRHHHLRTGCLDRLWHEKLQKHAALVDARAQELTTAPHKFRTAKTAYDAYEPTYTCHSEWRTGVLFGDGGKFVCGNAAYFRAKSCLVYSVGSSGDFTFEADVVKRFGCEVHTFDPTGNTTLFASMAHDAGATFHAWGVGPSGTTLFNGATGDDNPLISLTDVVHNLGHDGRHVDILKIDCEGCEWDAFAEVWPHMDAGAVSIGQIQVELHHTDFDRIRTFFEGAERAGYMIFHKERNQWGCDGYDCVEYSLIHATEARMLFDAVHCAQ